MIVVIFCVFWLFLVDIFCGGIVCIGWIFGGYKWFCFFLWWIFFYGGDGVCVGDCSGFLGGGYVRVGIYWKLCDNRGYLG